MWKRTALVAVVIAVLATACQFGNPEPTARTLPAAAPKRTLLMIGDSLMGQHDVAFPGVLAAHGIDATVIDAHVNGSGVIGPVGSSPSSLEWVQAQVTAH